jgi:ADP-dependent NAD(P)H-hydrate dehydratase / NAD(P)H-hydrate epimerase
MAGLGELSLDDVAGIIPAPQPEDDKYSRGVVGLAVGSDDYPGAATLASEAAMCAGAGMVRLIAPVRASELALQARPEIVIVPGRIDSLVVGSGMPQGSSADITARVALCDLSDDAPRIVDAAALGDAPHIGGPRILTPHAGEMTRLAESLRLPGSDPSAWAEGLAAHWGVVVILKGHRPEVFHPEGLAFRLPPGTAWLATAGTGDVLAGLLGALCALRRLPQWSFEDLALTAAAGVLVHQEAASRLSRHSGAGRPGPVLASGLARELSPVVASLVRHGGHDDS